MEEKEPIFSWEIKRQEDRQRGDNFYFIVLAVMALLLFFSIWQKNFLFGIFVIISTGTILFLSSQRQEVFSFKLYEKKIEIGENDHIYEYDRFSHFDIYEYHENDYELLFSFKEKLKPVLRIRIYKGDREKIEEFLKTKLSQKKTEPSLLDIISKIMGL